MDEYTFSVVIPAHNEEKYISRCIAGIKRAVHYAYPAKVEIIVVTNRCTDRTSEISKRYGAKVIVNDEKCISAIRNAGVNAASGKIIVTIDADSIMSKYSLCEIKERLESGKYIGGGSPMRFDRMSVGILCSAAAVAINLIPVVTIQSPENLYRCTKKKYKHPIENNTVKKVKNGMQQTAPLPSKMASEKSFSSKCTTPKRR